MINLFKKIFKKETTDFTTLVNKGAIIIDVRSQEEFKGGHIKGSRNIPLDLIPLKIDELQKMKRPLITVCQSGIRSRMATSTLSAVGLEVYNGGSWKALASYLGRA